jgi:hypothetical protein
MIMRTARRTALVGLLVGAAFVVQPIASGNQPPRAEVREIPVELPGVAAASEGTWRASRSIDAGDAVLVGAEWTPDATVRVQIRAASDGEWHEWHELVMSAGEGPEPDSEEEAQANWAASEPVWVGRVDHLQVRIRGGGPDTEVKIHTVDIGGDDSLAFDPEHRPGAASATTRPNFVSRSSWDPHNECRPRTSPAYASNVNFAVVHHTAGSNGYTSSQSANVVRTVCLYHRNTLGWSDIGYNIVVDRFGRTFEGRAGGLDRAVVGAHASGYNTGSTGISVLGCFDSTGCSGDTNIPWAAVDAVDKALAWKFTVHGVNPHGTTNINSRTIPNIVGHRDVGSTACPGNRFYTYVRGSQPMADRVQKHMAVRRTPVYGDWNGDGTTNIGWYYQGGTWRLLMPDGSIRSFVYGTRATDMPVTGDWNGNGRDGPGIFRRGGEWHLRNSLSSAPSLTVHTFTYGLQAGDKAVTGDWNGNGRDGVGVFRRGGEWHLRNSLSSAGGQTAYRLPYGLRSGDVPVTGDWNGNGRDGVGIFRKGTWGEWHLRNSLSNVTGGTVHRFTYGRSTDLPTTGDWNRNKRTGPGLVRGDTWFFNNDFDSASTSSANFGG